MAALAGSSPIERAPARWWIALVALVAAGLAGCSGGANDLATNAHVHGGTFDGDDAVEDGSIDGASPLVLRGAATREGSTADSVYYEFWALDDSLGAPVGLVVNQKVDVFVHLFHNFLPREGWTFTADGAHPLPPP